MSLASARSGFARLPLTGLYYWEKHREESRYTGNAGSYWLDRLGVYQTPQRMYDPVLGRFWGMDKLADLYTSVSPMAFGFNNPLLFADPTGLAPDCEGCPEFQLPLVTVSSKPDQSNRMMLESQLQLMRQSRNPVYRNLGQTAYREGLQAARDLYQRGRTLHFSETQAQASRYSPYLEGIGKMVTYGISGSMVAAAASPALLRGMAEGLGARVVQRMGMEAGLQMGMSLILRRDLAVVDYADILTTGVFGKFAFFGHALLDLDSSTGLSDSFGILGQKKSILATTIDGLVGGFNFGYGQLLNNSEIDRATIHLISTFNGGARTIVGQVSTLDN